MENWRQTNPSDDPPEQGALTRPVPTLPSKESAENLAKDFSHLESGQLVWPSHQAEEPISSSQAEILNSCHLNYG
jgi:hypothetical protein